MAERKRNRNLGRQIVDLTRNTSKDIRIVVRNEEAEKFHYYYPLGMALGNLISSYYLRKKTSYVHTHFTYKGVRITDEESPQTRGMWHGSTILAKTVKSSNLIGSTGKGDWWRGWQCSRNAGRVEKLWITIMEKKGVPADVCRGYLFLPISMSISMFNGNRAVRYEGVYASVTMEEVFDNWKKHRSNSEKLNQVLDEEKSTGLGSYTGNSHIKLRTGPARFYGLGTVSEIMTETVSDLMKTLDKIIFMEIKGKTTRQSSLDLIVCNEDHDPLEFNTKWAKRGYWTNRMRERGNEVSEMSMCNSQTKRSKLNQ